MRGRPPKPTQLKILAGNPGRRPLNESEPKPALGKPAMPPHIRSDPVAAKEWRAIMKLLADMGLLTKADRVGLALYCQAYSRWVDASEKVKTFGIILKSKNDTIYQSPYLAVINKSFEQIQKFLSEWGLTPSSRTRIHVQANTGCDELAAFTRNRKSSG